LKSLLVLVAAVLIAALGCDGPLYMLPGGELSGSVNPAPEDWKFTDSHEEFQLETRPDDPYSVNIWGVALRSGFYIMTSRETDWSEYVEADPHVRLRVGEDIYELKAERSDDRLDRRRLKAALRNKYDGFEPDAELEAKAVAFRLVPR